ncbi:MAG: ribbon-helix-helix protein, CopG family [Spirochaetes bacterium]|nr:ribbon-helix-helix protein, CopG family [Spirochaetota bacterium]
MKTFQMTLDEKLIKKVDKEVKKLKTTRSAFTREALRKNLEYYHELELEKKQINGYKNYPIKHDEFSDWENEQVWID